ncbi:MAG: ankyrin repeat domain-containing protein [Burkholderiales bacterium]
MSLQLQISIDYFMHSKSILLLLNSLLVIVGFLSTGVAHAADSYQAMLAAVKNGNVPVINELLRKGIDVDSTDRTGSTLLMTASSLGKLDAARALVAHKASVNARNQYGESALMMAAIRDHRPIVEYLLGSGAEVNPPGWTPLMFAAVKGHDEIARMLLDKGANVNASSENGTTALMLAAKEGNLDTVLLLAERGAALNLRNLAGATALGLALDGGRKDVADALIRSGAEQ